ncbi:hypothetical protein [Paenibacillus arenilitoris]|uniref:Uncharacterized protein n=1 Tax=Paenibacillus arenilitoris TaxID=2772299 RepID=A0A927H976_9BACL|nr:hypothetical protein [Paenibacillus arenilitoris]MBD2872342.1 hypothetical protein [Paenibacillus arenilitoris]
MTRSRKHPALIVAGNLMYTYRWVLATYWLVFIVIYVGIGFILRMNGTAGGDIDGQSIWEGAGSSPKIFLMVVGIMMTPLSLASFVANGITRRHFIGGVMLVIAIFAIVSSILLTVGYPIERAVYEMNGWPLALKNPHLFETTRQYGWIFVESFLLFFAYFGSGWLIGSGFYRFHWRVAIVLSALALLPAMAMEVVLYSDWMGQLLQTAFEADRAPMPLALSLSVIVAALTAALNYLMLRHVAIKKKLI